MRVLIYKRTHDGDPDDRGCFGVLDCMGVVRSLEYDAVIGIGGIGPEARAAGIAGKINWIGLTPSKTVDADKRGPLVTFASFLNFGTDGPDFTALAPILAGRIYTNNIRYLIVELTEDDNEIRSILALAAPQRKRKQLHSPKKCPSR